MPSGKQSFKQWNCHQWLASVFSYLKCIKKIILVTMKVKMKKLVHLDEEEFFIKRWEVLHFSNMFCILRVIFSSKHQWFRHIYLRECFVIMIFFKSIWNGLFYYLLNKETFTSAALNVFFINIYPPLLKV